MDANDARYEGPCRMLMAVAAGIHWATAAIYLRQQTLVQVEASDIYAWVGALLASVT